jgi:hypothetical protein
MRLLAGFRRECVAFVRRGGAKLATAMVGYSRATAVSWTTAPGTRETFGWTRRDGRFPP